MRAGRAPVGRDSDEGNRYAGFEMSNPHPQPSGDNSLELPIAVLLQRAKTLPPHDEMVIDDLTPDEGAAFLAALET